MENAEKSFDQISEVLKGPMESLGISTKAISTTLNGLVDEAESVLHAVERFFGLFKGVTSSQAAESAKHLVGPAVTAGVNYLGKGKKVGATVARAAAARPIPLAIGAVAVVGGIGLLVYYARKMDEQRRLEGGFHSELGTVEVQPVHH
jgi:hypothetical protein